MTTNVLVTAYAANPTLQGGGPVWTALRLLRTVEHVEKESYSFAAVFIDRVLRNLDDESLRRPLALLPRSAGLPLISYVLPTARYALRLRRTVRSMRRNGRVIIHAHDVISAYLARRLVPSVPRLLTIHTVGSWVTAGFLRLRPHARGSISERFLRHVERDAVRNARVVVFPAQGAAELFETQYPGIFQGKDVRVVHTGIELQTASTGEGDTAVLDQHGIRGKRLLLCVSPHRREKGLNFLVEAVADLPACTKDSLALLIVGQGPARPEIESQIAEYGLEEAVKLVDSVPEVAPLMRAADIFVLTPSETVFDLVLLEAMAARVPVVTTRLAGNLEMFGSESACLVAPGDPNAISEALLLLLRDQELGKALAERAYRRVTENFSISRMVSQYLDLYEEVGLKPSR